MPPTVNVSVVSETSSPIPGVRPLAASDHHGLIGLAVLLGALWAGLFWVFLVTLIAAILALREFYRFHPPAGSLFKVGPAEVAPAPVGLAVRIPGPQTTPAPPLSDPLTAPTRARQPLGRQPVPGQPAIRAPRHWARRSPVSPAPEAATSPEPSALPDRPAATPLPTLLGAAWVAAFVIGGAAAEGVLHLWPFPWAFPCRRLPLPPVAHCLLPRCPLANSPGLPPGWPSIHRLPAGPRNGPGPGGRGIFLPGPPIFLPRYGPTIYEVGRNWLLFALLANFATDTGALLVGRALGRHKMAPVTSPNKTWEGPWAGSCSPFSHQSFSTGLSTWGWAHVVGGSLERLELATRPDWCYSGCSFPLGDLVESRLKALSRLKDSGNLMPGPWRYPGPAGQSPVHHSDGVLSANGGALAVKKIVVLGSTGSIGRQTLDIVRAFPEEFEVVGLAAASTTTCSISRLPNFAPATSSVSTPPIPRRSRPGSSHGGNGPPARGRGGNGRHHRPAGLVPILNALECGKAVALSNKEPIVMAGPLLKEWESRFGGVILPWTANPAPSGNASRGNPDPSGG